MQNSKKIQIMKTYYCYDTAREGCDGDCNYCKGCLEADISDFENEIRADERARIIEEFVTMHNKCNTDLCDKVGKGISCCECIAEQLR